MGSLGFNGEVREGQCTRKHWRTNPTEMSQWKVLREMLKAFCTAKERIR